MILRRALLLSLITVLPYICWSQGIVVVGLPQPEQVSKPKKPSTSPNARKQSLSLPFFEDFSETETSFADPLLWLYGRSIRVNDGMAIHPPSLKTATFDGVDSTGEPYNVNDILSRGYADKLVSNSIDLTEVAEADRNTVFFSYQFQMKGNGEIPDEGDHLLLSFLDDLGHWVPMDTIENDGTVEVDTFYTSIVPVAEQRFYHEDFKFMIQNFARLSGPYDTWHVDYIYLNKGRDVDDLSFPDRTISEPMTGLFGLFRIMPVTHFFMDSGHSITHPSILVTNIRDDNLQPVNLVSNAYITYRDNGIVSETQHIKLDSSLNALLAIKGEYTSMTLDKLPDLLTLSHTADSISIELKANVNTKDNKLIGSEQGDYDPAIYSPIDFRINDTTRSVFLLQNKYAYDDGVAEYGAGLNQPGAEFAYEYEMVGVAQENITALELYFPRFGDESSQVIELRIWDDLKNDPLYFEKTTLQRGDNNTIWVKPLTDPVPVGAKFYIGWKQDAAAIIAAGLDKNNDTGDKMWYNTNGDWVKNTLVHGSLMFRPVFGKGKSEVGLEDEPQPLTLYPNPSNGTFQFAGVAQQIVVYDMNGRSISFVTESTTDETTISLTGASQGIYIMKIFTGGKQRTAKVMIK